ncbi:hypothetical protein WOLCODRAFT_150636 [Wolfiporia cocos MD-104 SS10]|uniref:Uncharacterized protein n=1 Tax=Wolfiporia cocos (strain MD-104) TaxID=742152 RepID=A0A2H3JWN9_WOLCO|nr:hypothetical protein WOLCODRAFT_150636 [Wolfiporia cocos MD-104 SS10]
MPMNTDQGRASPRTPRSAQPEAQPAHLNSGPPGCIITGDTIMPSSTSPLSG